MNIRFQQALAPTFLLLLTFSSVTLVEAFFCLAEARPKGKASSTRPKNNSDSGIIELKTLGAGKLDTSSPLQVTITESINLEIINPRSDWNKVYSIGRAALLEGDYRRAFNAFSLALIKAKVLAKDPHDQRLTVTTQALASLRPAATSLNARLGLKLDDGTKDARLKGKVDRVFPGSLAWLAGIKEDDRIISLRETGNVSKLLIERGGKKYSATITDSSKETLLARTPLPDIAKTPKASEQITDGNILKSNERLLANHDVILIIDKSTSMDGRLDASGKSKWEWCRDNAYELASLTQYFPNGVDVILFDDGYNYFRKMRPGQITELFVRNKPSGGTQLHEPLWDVLSRYFDNRNASTKPLMIAILSDFGTNIDHCRAAIFEAAQRVRHPGELTISLLEIGHGGELLVDALDNDMVNVGAPYDIVDATKMDEIQKIGLKGALVAALLKHRQHAASNSSSSKP